jgi:hypothetical protein
MAQVKQGSPYLRLEISEEDWERAKRSKSGVCLIADAIKKQYPQFSHPTVDMQTIRFSDREAGQRYTYLTPEGAQRVLLSFDQGWRQLANKITLQRAVKISPITRSSADRLTKTARREARKAELEAKIEQGEELTRGEKTAYTRITNAKPAPERPTNHGPAEVKGRHHGETVVHGGRPLLRGESHPNLLQGTDRHYGAKQADPGVVFKEALEAGIEDARVEWITGELKEQAIEAAIEAAVQERLDEAVKAALAERIANNKSTS